MADDDPALSEGNLRIATTSRVVEAQLAASALGPQRLAQVRPARMFERGRWGKHRAFEPRLWGALVDVQFRQHSSDVDLAGWRVWKPTEYSVSSITASASGLALR